MRIWTLHPQYLDSRGLTALWREALLARGDLEARMHATSGQVEHEWRHLLLKLRERSPAEYRRWRRIDAPRWHPMFEIVEGPVESWERA